MILSYTSEKVRFYITILVYSGKVRIKKVIPFIIQNKMIYSKLKTPNK